MRHLTCLLLLTACVEVPPDLPRAPADPVVPEARCPGHDVEIRIEGVARDPSGALAANVPIWWWNEATQDWTLDGLTDAQGAYAFIHPGPTWTAVRPWTSSPAMQCMGVPTQFELPDPSQHRFRMVMENEDFVVPALCAWRFELPGADGPVDLMAWRPDDFIALSTLAVGGVATPTLPCDLQAVFLATDTVASAADPACTIAPGAACVPVGDKTVALTPVPAVRVDVDARDASGATLSGVTITDGVVLARTTSTGRATVRVRADAHLVARAPEHLHAALHLGDGYTVRSDRGEPVEGGVPWRLSMPAARELALVCDRNVGRCPVVPRCRARGAPAAEDGECWFGKGSSVRCMCPEGQAQLIAAGFAFDVPPEAEALVRVKLPQHHGRIEGHTQGPCSVHATRTPQPWQAFTDPPRLFTRMATCDDEGRFTLTALTPGTWTVAVRLEGGAVVEQTVALDALPVDLGLVAPD